jgi:hypothetical protein
MARYRYRPRSACLVCGRILRREAGVLCTRCGLADHRLPGEDEPLPRPAPPPRPRPVAKAGDAS